MLMTRFIDDRGLGFDFLLCTVGQLSIDIDDLCARAGDKGNVAFFEIGDLVSHRGQSNRI